MKNYILLITVMIGFFTAAAQEPQWKTEILKDGKISVKSKITTQKINGIEKNVFYYIAETVADLNLEKAEAFMRNSSNYKKFLESMGETSEVKKINPNSWIAYIFFDNTWPISDNDCVQKFDFTKTNNGFMVTGKAVPNEYDMKDVSRISLYDVVYKFEKVADKKIKVTVDAVFSPTSSVPKVLMSNWLPGGPVRIITRMVNEIAK